MFFRKLQLVVSSWVVAKMFKSLNPLNAQALVWLSSMLFEKNPNISEHQRTVQESRAILLLTVQLRVSSPQWSLWQVSKRTSGLRSPVSSDWESGPTLPITKMKIQNKKKKERSKCNQHNSRYISDDHIQHTSLFCPTQVSIELIVQPVLGQNILQWQKYYIWSRGGLCWCKRCRGMGEKLDEVTSRNNGCISLQGVFMWYNCQAMTVTSFSKKKKDETVCAYLS